MCVSLSYLYFLFPFFSGLSHFVNAFTSAVAFCLLVTCITFTCHFPYEPKKEAVYEKILNDIFFSLELEVVYKKNCQFFIFNFFPLRFPHSQFILIMSCGKVCTLYFFIQISYILTLIQKFVGDC